MYKTLVESARALNFTEKMIGSLVTKYKGNLRPLCHAVLARGISHSYLISLRSVEEILKGWTFDSQRSDMFNVDPEWLDENRDNVWTPDSFQ
jgi:hypothetical protein